MAKKKGFGTVYRDVMCDDTLSLRAKALYGYLCVHAGNKGECYPSRRAICHDLHVSNNLLSVVIDELIDADVLKIKKERDKKGKFTRNIYIMKSVDNL